MKSFRVSCKDAAGSADMVSYLCGLPVVEEDWMRVSLSMMEVLYCVAGGLCSACAFGSYGCRFQCVGRVYLCERDVTYVMNAK